MAACARLHSSMMATTPQAGHILRPPPTTQCHPACAERLEARRRAALPPQHVEATDARPRMAGGGIVSGIPMDWLQPQSQHAQATLAPEPDRRLPTQPSRSPCIVSGSSFAISFECNDDPGLYALVLLAILQTVCGSCGAPAAHANALARRAFLSSSLRCRQPPVGGSGAGLSASLFPLSHSLVCRSIRLCHEQPRDAPAAAEHAAYRAERIAQVRLRAHARGAR